jgi:hypothetical protein
MGTRDFDNFSADVPHSGVITTKERHLWKAEVAALNKELTAVRQHMDWQARRINELELRLNTLGVK